MTLPETLIEPMLQAGEPSLAIEAQSSCRFCEGALADFVDLGMSPLCESFLGPAQLNAMEPFFPLHVRVCRNCFLAQVQEYVAPEQIFRDYAYFSSYSEAWLKHASDYAEAMIKRFRLKTHARVIELASNDGYLLRNFVKRGFSVLGIDPALNVARAAREAGVPTLAQFFGRETARRLALDDIAATLIVANNVLAQVPDLNDFVAGIPLILAPAGVVTIEFPHLLKLIAENQFDTIYHEHFSYFSLMTARRVLAAQGLRVFDVEELWTHGGSLRLYVCHDANEAQPSSASVEALIATEIAAGLDEIATYAAFGERVRETKRKLLEFLIDAKRAGRTVVGYGAPGKGNTLLNYCGIRTDFLDYTVDRNPHKHGKFLPGTHIPIFPPERIKETRPDYVLILPWNLRDEIMAQLAFIREWGGRFVVPIPEVTIYF
ncbi:MAG TPA: class I SAM-dependent methyltransferase [Stellaceae bacterium]|nr:class I SAM-dependent methyltransferase [Stellaceae bacterium]